MNPRIKNKVYLSFLLPIFLLMHYSVSAQNDDLNKKIKVIDSLGFYYENIPNYDSAIYYYQQELNLYKKEGNTKETGRTLLKIGRMLSEKGEIAAASKTFFEMLKYSEAANDTIRISIAYTRIGRCFESLNQTANAYTYYFKALQIAEKYSIHKQCIALYGTLGNLFLQEKKYNECRNMALKADSLAKQLKDPYFQYGADNIQGLYYNAIGDFKNAEKFMTKALNYNLKKNPISSHTAGTYLNLGDIASKQEKDSEAINYFLKAYKIFKNQNEKKNLKDITLNLSELYSKTNNFKKAFEYRKEYSLYNDSIINERNNGIIAELQTKYEVAKKDHQIELLGKDKQLKEEKLISSKKRNYLYIGIIIISIIALFFTIMFFKQKQKASRLLSEHKMSSIRLQTQMNPHLIFNALVSMQDIITKDNKTKAFDAIGKLAKIMRATLNNSEKEYISLKTECEFLRNYIDFENARLSTEIKSSFEINESIDEEWTLIPPMLIQPFIENCFKHAFDSKNSDNEILLNIEKIKHEQKDLLKITVSDNGNGFVQAGDKDSKAIKITNQRIKQEHTKWKTNFKEEVLTFEGNKKNGKGTLVTIYLPIIE